MTPKTSKSAITLAVLTAALGFFVDAYDLLLYGIVRNQSLMSMGLSGEKLLSVGIDLLNAQLFGMLAGGVIFGILGDKRGRRSVLFGSIILYSAATLLNGFVYGIPQYAACRFLAGVGLSGELGAGVTLVSELMSKELRGYGTMLIAAIGVLGVVAASLIGDALPWRTAYMIGGALGTLLLILRFGVAESELFNQAKTGSAARGNFLSLFTNAQRLRRYICLILVAMPIWYAIGILITFSPELGKTMGLFSAPQAGKAILLYYSGLTLGDLTNGWLSQMFKTRKKIVLIFLVLTAGSICAYFIFGGRTLWGFYALCGLLGWASGYWAVFVTVAAESFGTNVRATVAITAPNFVRGLTALLALTFKGFKPSLGVLPCAMAIGAVVVVLAFISFSQIEETFGKDLDYLEV